MKSFKQPVLPSEFFDNIEKLSFLEIAFEVAHAFLKDHIESAKLKRIIKESLNFPLPLISIEKNIYSLELFHGPSFSVTDFGAWFLPHLFYYFDAYSKVACRDLPVVFSVPYGNSDILTAGLLAKRMGLPVKKFILAKASSTQIKQTIKDVYKNHGYILDPHGAASYLGLVRYKKRTSEPGCYVLLQTEHPAKQKETIEEILNVDIPMPKRLMNDYSDFKHFLL